MPHSNETITAAKLMYLRGVKTAELAVQFSVSTRTIYNWAKSGDWDSLRTDLTAPQIMAQRFCMLSEIDNKTPAQLKEFETLAKMISNFNVDLARAEKIKAETRAIDRGDVQGQNQSRGKRSRKKKLVRNDITNLDLSIFDKFAKKNFFKYQFTWRENIHQRNRFILKPRQVGATYYFAFEALEDGFKKGENQIFLSASKDQAKVFKSYIIAFCLEFFDLELKGSDSIDIFKDGKLWCTFYFLSTNASTAQSYHGHLYVDEVFWIPNYKKLQKVASAMAAHKKWRRTYFSTPSSIQHAAYKHWSGELYNAGKSEKKRAKFDLTLKTLRKGSLGADNIWRFAFTIVDAEKQGCNLFDLKELRQEYGKNDFDNLFMCKFIDDHESVFPFSMMQPCMVERSIWIHVKDSNRPLGNRPVAIGYDPSRVGDDAALAVLEMPLTAKQKWRLIEKDRFKGHSSEYQVNRILEVYKRFNVQHLGIDCTGPGYDVFHLLQHIPEVVPINYSLEVKTALVQIAKRLINSGRFEYDVADSDVTQSFMMITQQTTANDRITYAASRNADVGHADLAFAVMHAFYAERAILSLPLGNSGGSDDGFFIG